MENNVISLTTRRKIIALEENTKELGEIAISIKSAIQSLSKHTNYSNIKYKVNDLFELYTDVKQVRSKKLEILERLKNE